MGESHYTFDEWLGLRKSQRYSSMVEVKVAEMASETDYRETARVLKEWTPVNISHTTVGSLVKRVGKTQAREDVDKVIELNEAASLPEGMRVDLLYAEADGVFVRGTQKKKSLEVHAVIHEGWDKNSKRVSLREPKVIMRLNRLQNFGKKFKLLLPIDIH